jgi:hypothetical protein
MGQRLRDAARAVPIFYRRDISLAMKTAAEQSLVVVEPPKFT